jgi:hypothetical protein
MSQRQIIRIVLASACSAGLIGAWSGEAAARGAKRKAKGAGGGSCVAAYKTGMPLQEAGHLIEARRALMGCVVKTCGALLRRECKKELSKATRGIASVLPTVTDESGAAVTEVEVTMDGAVLAPRLTGKQLFVDPGEHQFSFKTSGGSASQSVSVAVGERSRPIAVSLAGAKKTETEAAVAAVADPLADVPAESPPAKRSVAAVSDGDEPRVSRRREIEPSKRGSSHVGAYVLGGIGVLGVGGYGLLTYWGRQQNSDLDRCSPNCPRTNIDHIKKLYLYSDISLGVGLAALVASTWLFVTSDSSAHKEVATGRKPFAFDLKATGSSAFATLSGGF